MSTGTPPNEKSQEEETPQKKPDPKIELGVLFRYSTRRERLLLVIASICAFAEGAAFPAFTFVFGAVLDTVGTNAADLQSSINTLALAMLIISIAVFLLAAIWSSIFNFTAVRQGNRLRRAYLASVLAKDIEWFDSHTPAEIPTRLTNEIDKFQNAVSQKAGLALMNICQALSGMLLGFIKGWQVALVVMAGIPFIAVSTVFLTKYMAKASTASQTSYAKAGAVTEEVISSIRTVVSFGAELFELGRYTSYLGEAKKSGIQIGLQIGISLGAVMMITFFSYALTFWFGSYLIANGITNSITGQPWKGSEVVVVFLSVLMGTFGLGQIGPSISAFAEGTAALRVLTETIETKSNIEPSPLRRRPDGTLVCAKPWVTGGSPTAASFPRLSFTIESITLNNVLFRYPTRPESVVLKNLSLTIKGGQKVALVGESGSGKSTIVSLLERFYDPEQGTVNINGTNIREYDPRSLRSLFGYVGQEPVMFATSIKGNLTYGFPAQDLPTDSELVRVLEMANVYTFVASLPDGLNTYCGPGGSQISGGQKQRIAIARALLRKPKILLLDEATSALDNESEKMVQHTIDNLQSSTIKDLTTISVAHRLSTIRNSDTIFVLKNGEVVEQGTHEELLSKPTGVYHALVATQESRKATPGTDPGLSVSIQHEETFQTAKGEEDRQATPESPHKQMLIGKSPEQLEKERIAAINKSYSIPWRRLWSYSKPERWLYIPAIFGAFAKGVAFPIHSVIFSAVITWYYVKTDLMNKVRIGSLEYVGLGVGVFIGIVLDLWLFAIISESFTLRIRQACFRHVLGQDMAFFDKPENAPARLQLALSTWTSKMNAITTNVIGVFCEVFAALVAGLIIAFLASPKLAAVLLATLPIVVGTAALATSIALGATKDDSGLAQQAAQVASEAVQNMKTVRALTAEYEALYLYEQLSMKKVNNELKRAWSNGAIFGFSMGAIFLPYSLGYWYGGKLVADGELDLQNLSQALLGLLLGALGAGQALSFMADIATAKAATHDVFNLLDTPSKISPYDVSHNTEISAVFPPGSDIVFENVRFSYPSRPEVEILRGLSFTVHQGQKVALVGPSGGGKSTVMALLQRFYDPNEGRILMNQTDVRDLDVAALRAVMGYVGQEPVLFDATMEQNIVYGNREATQQDLDEMKNLAKLDFIKEDGVHWDTVLGPKGGLLSGGQKQRTAIARALIRDPKILLLDEATSALDSASEHTVQAAIDAAAIGRTTFVIAHRLSTVQDADIILVISSGQVVESGTHEQLMNMRSAYYQLYMQGQK